MNCKKKRTIFNLFEVLNCDSCTYHKLDEEFYIGNIKISIYYLEDYCEYFFKDIKDKDLFVINSKKIRTFLKDAIISKMKNENIIILWLDSFDINLHYELLEMLLGFELDIYIMANF